MWESYYGWRFISLFILIKYVENFFFHKYLQIPSSSMQPKIEITLTLGLIGNIGMQCSQNLGGVA